MNSYYIESLGCAKNLVDSEVFAAIMQRAGLSLAAEPEDADIVLVNTCAFLRDSLEELDMVLDELASLKTEKPEQRLLVTGCVMNRALDDFREAFPEVDAWIALKDFSALEKYLHLEAAAKLERSPLQCGYHKYLRISDGCCNNCSYCTIPSIRGTLQSIPIEQLVEEARALAEDDECPPVELVVIAQDTANYGVDIYGRQALPELLEQLHALPGYRWIRVMYLHPDHFDTSWLGLWKKLPKLLPYFEIPIQHSEDAILQAMNRKKGRAQLQEMFGTILREVPDAVLRTTLISGFPGETKEQALALKNFVKAIPFTHLGVFLYSPEEGTPAAAMASQVPTATAERRRDSLLNLQGDRMSELLEVYVGRVIPVLVEECCAEDEDEAFVGRAWFQAPEVDGRTYIEGADLLPGTIYQVRIEDVIDADLFGEVVT